jgi:hypothetical protein
MDPLAIIAVRQQHERLSAVSRRFCRHGAPRRSPRLLRTSIGFGVLIRVLDAVKSWWFQADAVRRGSES